MKTLVKRINDKSLELCSINRQLEDLKYFLSGEKEGPSPNTLTGDISSLPLSLCGDKNESIINYLNNTEARLDDNIDEIKSKIEEIYLIIGFNAP